MRIPKYKSLAGDAWLAEIIRRDEANLPPVYERPLKKIKRSRNPFTSEVAKRGFAGACYRVIAPLVP